MRAFVLLIACADAFTSTHSFEALPAPRGEPTTDAEQAALIDAMLDGAADQPPAPRNFAAPARVADERCMSVCYTDDSRTVNRWLRENAAGAAALGFDTETACAFNGRKPPAPGPHVLQLAAGDACLVAHLVSGDVCASGALADVLSDPSVVKVGVGLDDDAVELYNIDSRMKLSGRLDIGGPRKGRRIALREVAHRCIGGPIAPKAKKIACSNWAMRRLQSKQLAYAARDAWLGAAVYGALAADPAFTDAVATQIEDEMPIAELTAVAADRRVIKRRLKALDEDAEDYDARVREIRRELKKFPRPDPRLELDIFADD